jgi:uncharacterized repeat protein (TIGR01451 family)
MFPSPWRNWLRRLSRSMQGRRRRPSRSPALRPRRPQLERLEERTVPTVAITNYNGLNFGQTAAIQAFTIGGAAIPPDPQGAAGPYSYVEAINLSVAIFDPRTNGINPITDALDDFFNFQGNLPDPNPDPLAETFFTDPQVAFDNQTQRFLVGCMEVSPGSEFGSDFNGNDSSVYDLAVSKSSNPITLTTADWNFYQVNTTEAGFFSDFPGNLGFNAGALVVTLNEFNTTNVDTIDHVLVNAISMSDLTNGVPQAGLHVYQTHFQGASLRPATMHDSTSADDPMWLVQEHPGTGGLGDGQHVDVVKMTDVLSGSPTFTTTTLAVNPYTDVSLVPPLQPDGSVVTPEVDSRILKVAEQNHLLVATHSVAVSPTEDDAQWYVIDVGSGTPQLKDQGDVSGGDNTYLTYPAIDINPAGDIGMTYMQSGTDSETDFLSMVVTGRTPSDPPGTMRAPVVAQAGQQVYQDFGPLFGFTQRAGDLSGINVDADGTFWAINEFADDEPLPTTDSPWADWGTNITRFTLDPVADLSVTAGGPATVTPGTTASYTITLTNNGPDDAQSVVLSDILPAGATNASITSVSNPDGFSFTLANGVFTSAAVPVPNGHQDVFTVTVSVPGSLTTGAAFDNITSVTSTTLDSNPYNSASTVIGSTGQSITISTNYNALNFGQAADLLGGAGATPPDPQGAVGPDSYVEAVNDAVAIFAPRTSAANPVTDSLDDFFFTQGNLNDPNPDDEFGNFFTDPQVVYVEQIHRFIVGAMEVDPGPQFVAQSTGDNSSVFDLAVSTSSNPTTLTTADWTFYQVRTTEAGFFSDYPGNLGYNGGALVVALNEFETRDLNQTLDHVLVTAVNLSDLASGVPQAELHVYQSDFQGGSLRPATMHDSTSADDPMWLVQEHPGAGGSPDGQHIDVVKMTDVLSSTPTFTTTTLAVNPYAQVVQPLQPDGSGVTPALDSRILKVAGQGGTLVAAHHVSNAAGNQDLVQWYQVDVSSGTPVLHDQGDVGSGPNTYLYFPGIDINPAGDIGLSYIQSGTDSPDDFMSMYVTGRTPSDPPGTMEAPVLAQAGLQVYEDFATVFAASQRAGDLSGINVDADGTFWAINEFADDEPLPTTPDNPVADITNPVADWATNVVSFTLPAPSISPLAFTQLTPPSATEQQPTGTFTVATFTDSNPNPDINHLTATINWGDGQSDTLTGANGGIVQNADGSFSLLAGHTYAEEATGLTFSVQVVDSAGGSAVTSATLNVADAALAITQLAPPGATEGVGTGTLTVATFTDANPSPDINDYTATVAWGDGQSDTLTAANGGIVQNADGSFGVVAGHTYAEEGSGLTFSVQVADAGGSSASQSATLNVADAALAITQLAPPRATEGVGTGSLTVATFTDANPSPDINDFTATVSWGDGLSDTLTAANGGIVQNADGSFSLLAGHTYAEEATGLTFAVQVTDAGGASASDSATISVADAALSITQLTPPSATEGAGTGSLTLASFTDANPSPDISDYTATVAWGDGQSDTLTAANGGIVQNADGSFGVVAGHTYAEEGSGLTFSVQVTDAGGSSASQSATLSVADAPLTATGSALTATAGVAYDGVVASFTDSDPNGTAADYSATIDWGDGTSSAGTISANSQGGFDVSGNHTETLAKTYAISVTITDVGGSSATANGTLTVNAAAPSSITATGGDNQNAPVGTAFASALQATVTDQYGNLVSGASVTFTAPASGASGTFSNGDTTITVTTDASGLAGATLTANTTAGSYSVTATVGGVATPASFSLTNTLVPAAIKAKSGTPQKATVGVAFAKPLRAKVTDANGNPVVGVSVTFTAPASGAGGTFSNGDTTITVTTDASGLAGATLTANTTAGSYSVTATVGGVATPASFSLTNEAGAPAAITATGGDNQSTPVGTAFASALQATVTDQYGNPVSGVRVTFKAPSSGASGTFSKGKASIKVTTDSSGVASATFTANKIKGTYQVEASFVFDGVTYFTLFTLTNT